MPRRKPRHDRPELNAGSMADIAFLLLIFFLVTTTIAEESGVLVRLPEWTDDPIDRKISDEAVLSVLINTNDELMVENERIAVADLPGRLIDHLRSPGRAANRKLVSLMHDRGTSYAKYLSVYDALKSGYSRIWNETANDRYGRAFTLLSEEQQAEVLREFPMVISEAEPSEYE